MGTDGFGNPVGFLTFTAGGAVNISTTTGPPSPVPGAAAGNNVLETSVGATSFAGFQHSFENAAADTWISQDWTPYDGVSFWLHGTDARVNLYFTILDNRRPGSTADDAERWAFIIRDDFVGWRLFQPTFPEFARLEIGNGALNDGLGLTEVWGYSFTALNTSSTASYFLDDVALFSNAPPVPVPAALPLLASSLVILGAVARRRKKG